MDFEKHINTIMKLHGSQKRGHDKNVPYFMHPIGCAAWALEDNNGVVNSEARQKSAMVLLYHDVLEDTDTTKEELLNHLNDLDEKDQKEIAELVQLCTIGEAETSKDEYEKLKSMHLSDLPEEVWYVKLVDKYFNIFGSTHYFHRKGTLSFYKEFVEFLAQRVKQTHKFKNSKFIESAMDFVKNN